MKRTTVWFAAAAAVEWALGLLPQPAWSSANDTRPDTRLPK